MSSNLSRANVAFYFPWVIVGVLCIKIFYSSSINPASDMVNEFIGTTKSADSWSDTLGSSASLSSFSMSSKEGQRSREVQSSMEPLSVIPPWADNILTPDHAYSKVKKTGKCIIGESEWERCGINDRFCATHGEHSVAASQIHVGQTTRLQRILHKAASGKPITLAVIGGSVTTGVGIHHKPHRNYKFQLAHWWAYAFPDSPMTFVDGSVHGQGSPFFSVCFNSVLPQDVDIVFIDSAINDVYQERDAVSAESLMRGIMQMQNQPAIILLQTFGLTFDKIATGGSLHLDIAAYYDLPVLSARQVMLPYIFKDPESVETYFGLGQDGSIDLRHISPEGHTIMADMTIQFLSTLYCKVQNDIFLHGVRDEAPLLDPPEDLPSHRLMDRYDPKREFPIYSPVCNSTESKFRPLVPFGPTTWKSEEIKGKKTLAGHHPGDEIRFKVNLITKGTLQVNFLRSSFYGLGIGKCHIDAFGPESAVTLDGFWNFSYSVGDLITLKEDLPPGEYEIICVVQEETHAPNGEQKVMIVSIQSF